VRYLATLLGANDEDVLRYFILVVALLLDPAAVLLLLAATMTRSYAPRREPACRETAERVKAVEVHRQLPSPKSP
jgi:hypothetical protein